MNIKLLALFVSLTALSGTALADAPKARHDWTGFYVGGFVGGGAGAKTNTTEPVGSGGPWNTSSSPYSYHTNASVMGGGAVGYNWQLGRSPYLIGLEGEYGYLGSKGSGLDPNSVPVGSDGSHSTEIGGSYGYGVIGGRLGYAYERSLFYVKSGAVFTSTQSGYTDACDTGSCGDNLLSTSGKSNNVGHAIGGGIEQALPPEWFKLAKNISIKAEYLYLGIGRTQTTSGTDCLCDLLTTTDRISGIHTAKIGINYRFRGL
jgi:outer membrane immunogenic protein